MAKQQLLEKGYLLEQTDDEDIITIPAKMLAAWKENKSGVQSNCMAVKILEHISSYYFVGEWDHREYLASVFAHKINKRHMRSESEFVANLLGIKANNFGLNDMDMLIKAKKINPALPIEIGIRYGTPDAAGVIHGYHALRVDKTLTNGDGTHSFVLVNPWDNQKYEIFSEAEIRKRQPSFSIYNLDENRFQLEKLIVKCTEEEGRFIYAESRKSSFDQLLQLHRQKLGGLSFNEVQGFIQQKMKETGFVMSPAEIKNRVEREAAQINEIKKNQPIISSKDIEEHIRNSLKQTLPDFIHQKKYNLIKECITRLPHQTVPVLLEILATNKQMSSLEIQPALGLIIAQCASNKNAGQPKNISSFEESIKNGLLMYYMNGNREHITRELDLRNLLSSIEARSNIPKFFVPSEFVKPRFGS